MSGCHNAMATAGAVTAAGMIATPLARRGSNARRWLADVVVAGLSTTTTLGAAGRWGLGRAIAAKSVIGAVTLAVERVGTTTGWPFGRYRYTDRLPPTVAGVPVAVPLAWWGMALPAREAAHAALGRRTSPFGRVGLGAVALTAWDLFLDPQMTAEGYWRWERRGVYRGIPASNFVGWLVTGAAVMAVLEWLLAPRQPDQVLVAEYGAMGVMETVGFAAFFRDLIVAAVGGAAMVPIAVAALVRRA